LCPFYAACSLTWLELGGHNAISTLLRWPPLSRFGRGAGGEGGLKSDDGRLRISRSTREKVYRYLIESIRRQRPDLEIGLCLEDEAMFAAIDLREGVGRCDRVL
jgi:hypothetical protein